MSNRDREHTTDALVEEFILLFFLAIVTAYCIIELS